MDDERDISILWWPVRLISEFRVHLIVTTVIGTVWCAGWGRAVQSKLASQQLRLPPLVMLETSHGRRLAEQPTSDAADQQIESLPAAPTSDAAPHAKQYVRRVRSYGPMATLRDGVE
jgi:hypothetical protein